MSKLRTIELTVSILAGIVYLTVEAVTRLPPLANYLGFRTSIPLELGVPIALTGIVVALILRTRMKKAFVDPRFVHLITHYSQRKDAPDTPNPARPRYVENSDTKQAYFVSDLIEPYIKQHKLQWFTYDGEKAMRAYFRRVKIQLHETSASPEELGLRLNRDGSLSRILPESEIVSKLKGRKLDDLRVIKIYPWYCRVFPFLMRRGAPRTRLLLKYSTKEAFDSHIHDLELIDNEIIDSQNYIFRPFDNTGKWCQRCGYRRVVRRFTDNQLLESA